MVGCWATRGHVTLRGVDGGTQEIKSLSVVAGAQPFSQKRTRDVFDRFWIEERGRRKIFRMKTIEKCGF